MHTARIVFCFALLGLAGQAGAEDTPYKHQYLNGGHFEGAPDAGNAALRGDHATPTQVVETHTRRSPHHNFDGEAAAQADNAPESTVQTSK